MHVLGLVVGVSMGIPGIVANVRNRAHLMPLTDKEATPLEELPVLTAAAMAVGSFIRVPNQVSGLLQALYGAKPNHNNAIRFGIMSFSSFFAGLVFFVTLWLMATRLGGRGASNDGTPLVCTKEDAPESTHKNSEEGKREKALISAAVSTGVLALTALYFLRGWRLKRAFPRPGGGWDKFLNALQLCSLPLGAVAFIPQFVDIHRHRGLTTDALSVWTTVLYVLDSMLRLPNVGKGLFRAVRNRNRAGNLSKMILSMSGIVIIIGVFYATLVCQAVYNTDTDEETRRSKRTAAIFSVVFAVCILLVVAYMIKGFNDPTFRR